MRLVNLQPLARTEEVQVRECVHPQYTAHKQEQWHSHFEY